MRKGGTDGSEMKGWRRDGRIENRKGKRRRVGEKIRGEGKELKTGRLMEVVLKIEEWGKREERIEVRKGE